MINPKYWMMLESAGLLMHGLYDTCQRVALAGSIRRGHPTPKDIELVAIPTRDTYHLLDMWLKREAIRQRVNKRGHRIAWGDKWRAFEMYSREYEQWIPVDLFIATPSTWGTTMAIRTGDKDFSAKMVTPRDKGGFMPKGVTYADWVYYLHGAPCPAEQEWQVFKTLDMPYVKPYLRSQNIKAPAIPYGLTLANLVEAPTYLHAEVKKGGKGKPDVLKVNGHEQAFPSGLHRIESDWYCDGNRVRLGDHLHTQLNHHLLGYTLASVSWVGHNAGIKDDLIYFPADYDGGRASWSNESVIRFALRKKGSGKK